MFIKNKKKKYSTEDKNGEINDLVLYNKQLTQKLNQTKLDFKLLQQENKKMSLLIQNIINCLNANKYNNQKVVLNKIKELVYDHHVHN